MARTVNLKLSMRPLFRSVSLALMLVTLIACSTIPLSKPQSPNVTVAGVRPINFSLTSQTIGLTLRVENPNGFDLPMQSLTFNARFAGEQFAQGHSVDEVLIPANGQALLEVEVKAGLGKLATQLRSLLDTNSSALDYDVTGLVKLANWPKAIPFNVEGEIDDPRINN